MTAPTPRTVPGHDVTFHELDGSHAWTCSCGAGREWAITDAGFIRAEADAHLDDAEHIAFLPQRDLAELLDEYGGPVRLGAGMVTWPGPYRGQLDRAAALRAEIDQRLAAPSGETAPPPAEVVEAVAAALADTAHSNAFTADWVSPTTEYRRNVFREQARHALAPVWPLLAGVAAASVPAAAQPAGPTAGEEREWLETLEREVARTNAQATTEDAVHRDVARQLDMLQDDQIFARWLDTCDPRPTTMPGVLAALAEKLRRPSAPSGEQPTGHLRVQPGAAMVRGQRVEATPDVQVLPAGTRRVTLDDVKPTTEPAGEVDRG